MIKYVKLICGYSHTVKTKWSSNKTFVTEMFILSCKTQKFVLYKLLQLVGQQLNLLNGTYETTEI